MSDEGRARVEILSMYPQNSGDKFSWSRRVELASNHESRGEGQSEAARVTWLPGCLVDVSCWLWMCNRQERPTRSFEFDWNHPAPAYPSPFHLLINLTITIIAPEYYFCCPPWLLPVPVPIPTVYWVALPTAIIIVHSMESLFMLCVVTKLRTFILLFVFPVLQHTIHLHHRLLQDSPSWQQPFLLINLNHTQWKSQPKHLAKSVIWTPHY